MHTIELATLVNIVNIAILLSLIYVYIKNFLSIKATFCMGLMIFAVLFLIQNLVAAYFQFFHTQCYSPDTGQFSLILNLIQMFGFSVLAYVTWKP